MNIIFQSNFNLLVILKISVRMLKDFNCKLPKKVTNQENIKN